MLWAHAHEHDGNVGVCVYVSRCLSVHGHVFECERQHVILCGVWCVVSRDRTCECGRADIQQVYTATRRGC